MSQPTHVNHGQVVSLANQMDELSHRAQDVLQRYEDVVTHAHAGGSLVGAAGSANLVSSAQIKEAQSRSSTGSSRSTISCAAAPTCTATPTITTTSRSRRYRARCAGPDARPTSKRVFASLTERWEFS